MTEKLITAEQVAERKPWIDLATGEVFFEIGDDRVFVPRVIFIHLFQAYSEKVAGLANKR